MTTTAGDPDLVGDAPSQTAPTHDSQKQARPRRRFSISVINFWLDASLLTILCALGWVSATLQIVFPAPTTADGWTLWSLSYDQWRDIQFVILCLLALGIVVHVMMHWNWVCSVIAAQIVRSRSRPDDGMQTIYGVATLIVLFHVIAAAVIAALLSVHQPAP